MDGRRRRSPRREAVGYLGAGTCEFLLAADGSFYFLEMNTRIQVEHPVTELVYGVDLVREQLRIAAGEPMRGPPDGSQPRGWAMECRITSEDPGERLSPVHRANRAAPRFPAAPVCAGTAASRSGDEVTLFYDSLLAKLIVWAPDRAQAIDRMARALDELVMEGVATNQAFHRRLMADAEFREGDIDIQFLERRPELLRRYRRPEQATALAVAAALAEDEARARRRPSVVAMAKRPSRSGSARRGSRGLR